MWINPKILEDQGFELIADPQPLAARFYGLETFKIQGFTIDEDCVISSRNRIVRGVCCDLVVVKSVNTGCRELFDDDFVEDEAEWLRKNKAEPPFLMVRVGPTEPFVPQGGRMRRESDKQISTYEAFTEARSTVSTLARRRVMPQLITALSSHFGRLPEEIRLKSIYYGAIGITERGETIHDFMLTARAELQVSRHHPKEEISGLMRDALEGESTITHRSADYFLLAEKESGELKAFLFYFLSIEVHVYKVFKGLDRAAHLKSLLAVPERVPVATASLLSCAIESDDLKDQFIWCALCAWVELGDEDIASFRLLKDLRNDIAHGRVDSVSRNQVRSARQLASKIFRQHQTGGALREQ